MGIQEDREQLFLELINRARLDPMAEALRYSLPGLDLSAGTGMTITGAAQQALAYNANLYTSATVHNRDMITANYFNHPGSDGSTPTIRIRATGYLTGASAWGTGENIAASRTSGPMDATAANAAVLELHRLLFLSNGHRANILDQKYEDVGISALTSNAYLPSYNALVSTHNYGYFTASANEVAQVTGVHYTDSDNNDFYSVGESAAGRTVQLLSGGTVVATTTTAAAGGYQLKPGATGNVEVVYSGGGLTGERGASFFLGTLNVKADLTDGNTIETNVSATITRDTQNLTLLSIDNVNGTGNSLNNIIKGNKGNNTLDGAGGNDTLQGGDGNDVLVGGAGNDSVNGGNGTDTAQFSGNFATYAFNYNSITSSYTVYGSDGSIDTVTGVESFQFADGTRTPALLPITSGPPVRSVSVTALNATQNEGNSGSTTYTFELRLNAAAFSSQTVNYAVAGTGAAPTNAADFAGSLAGTVTFAAGETVKTVVVSVAGDTVAESNESFALNLLSPTSGLALGTASATSTIVNDDTFIRNVGISAVTSSLPEGNTGTTAFTFNVNLDAAATSAQTVSYRIGGSGTNAAGATDFAGGQTGSVSFAAGETTKTVTVLVVADAIAEANETFGVTLFNATSGLAITTATAAAIIINDDSINLTSLERTTIGLTSSSVYGGNALANLLDDNVLNFAATASGADEWIKLDFGHSNAISDVILTNRNAAGYRLNGTVVKLLDANGTVVHSFAPIANATDGQVLSFHLDVPVNASSVYVDGAPSQFLQLAEIDVLGSASQPINLTDSFRARMSLTASSTNASYGLANALDNNVVSFATTQNGAAEWVKLSLGATDTVSDIVFTNRDTGGARLNGAIIQLLDSNDVVVYQSSAIADATDSEVFNFHLDTPTAGASIKIIGAPNQFLQIAELDVYGKPSSAVNLMDLYSAQVSVTSSSVFRGYVTANSIDNNVATFTTTANGADEWIDYNLGGTRHVTDVVLTNRDVGGARLNGAVVSLLDASGNVLHSFAPVANATDGQVIQFHLNTAVDASHILIDGAANQYLQIAELDFFGVV
jgi:hypothetical protein